jgi:hypothetical protein
MRYASLHDTCEKSARHNSLRPVADLVARFTKSISRFLDEPLEWTRPPSDDQEEQAAIDQVRRSVSAALHDLAVKRIIEEHLSEWRMAYDAPQYRGVGSTFRRAKTIHGIYDTAAPLPDAVMPPPLKEFLSDIRRLVISAIEASGGQVRLLTA